MSKVDKIKEEIGWLKVIFGILVVTDISIVAWLAKNYIAVITITTVVIWVNNVAYSKIDELEDL